VPERFSEEVPPAIEEMLSEIQDSPPPKQHSKVPEASLVDLQDEGAHRLEPLYQTLYPKCKRFTTVEGNGYCALDTSLAAYDQERMPPHILDSFSRMEEDGLANGAPLGLATQHEAPEDENENEEDRILDRPVPASFLQDGPEVQVDEDAVERAHMGVPDHPDQSALDEEPEDGDEDLPDTPASAASMAQVQVQVESTNPALGMLSPSSFEDLSDKQSMRDALVKIAMKEGMKRLSKQAPTLKVNFCLGADKDCKAKKLTKAIAGTVSAPFPYGASLDLRTSSITLGSLIYNAAGAGTDGEKALGSLGGLASMGSKLDMHFDIDRDRVDFTGKFGRSKLKGFVNTVKEAFSVDVSMAYDKPKAWEMGVVGQVTVDSVAGHLSHPGSSKGVGATKFNAKVTGSFSLAGFNAKSYVAQASSSPSGGQKVSLQADGLSFDVPVIGKRIPLGGSLRLQYTRSARGKTTQADVRYSSKPSLYLFKTLRKSKVLRQFLKYFDADARVGVEARADAMTGIYRLEAKVHGEFNSPAGSMGVKLVGQDIKLVMTNKKGEAKLALSATFIASGDGWGPKKFHASGGWKDGRLFLDGKFTLWGQKAKLTIRRNEGKTEIALRINMRELKMSEIPQIKGIKAADMGSLYDAVVVMANHEGSS